MTGKSVSLSFFCVGLQDPLCKFEIGLATKMAVVVGPRPGFKVFFFGAEVKIQQVSMRVYLRDLYLCLENGGEGFIAVLEQVLANEDLEIRDPDIPAKSREEIP